jgi:hypothetical protein
MLGVFSNSADLSRRNCSLPRLCFALRKGICFLGLLRASLDFALNQGGILKQAWDLLPD